MSAQEGIEAMLADLRAIQDPAEQAVRATEMLRAMHTANPEVKQIRQAAVAKLRELRHLSHAEVAELLNTSRGRAQQIAEGRRSGKRSDIPEAEDDEA